MSGVTADGHSGLFADPGMRPMASKATRSETAKRLDSAAHAMAGTMSLSYRRLGRFLGDQARVAHVGAALAGEGLRDLYRHAATLRVAARDGIREAMLSESRANAQAFGSPRWSAAPARNPLAGQSRQVEAALQGRFSAIDSFARARIEADGDRFDFFGQIAAERDARNRARATAHGAGSPRHSAFASYVAAEGRLLSPTPPVEATAEAPPERTAVTDTLASRLRAACAGACLGVLMTLRAVSERAVATASRSVRFLGDGARAVHCRGTIATWQLQDSPSARFAAGATLALGAAAAVIGLGYGQSGQIADGLTAMAQQIPTMSSADLAEHGEKAGRALASAWTRLGTATGEWLGGSEAGAGIVEAAHSNAAVATANAFASDLPLPPPSPPPAPVVGGNGASRLAAGAARRVASVVSAVNDLGATETLNRRSLEAASRGAEFLTETERLNAAELARHRGGAQVAEGIARNLGSAAPVDRVVSSPLPPPAGAGSAKLAAAHHVAPSGGRRAAAVAQHLSGGFGDAGKAAAMPQQAGWHGGTGGLVDRLRGLARSAADSMGNFGQPAPAQHYATGANVVTRARPF